MIWLQQFSSHMRQVRLQVYGGLRGHYATASDQTFAFRGGGGERQMQWRVKY